MALAELSAQLPHLVRRFMGSLRPGGPSTDDELWSLDRLNRAEQEIWRAMSGPDRRHGVAVARAAGRDVSDHLAHSRLEPTWIHRFANHGELVRLAETAALLHDSGKNAARLSTPARVMATMWWAVAAPGTADRWMDRGGVRLRLARYRRHPELGSRMLRAAGSHELVWRWAAEHHRPSAEWTVPQALGRILKRCDDD